MPRPVTEVLGLAVMGKVCSEWGGSCPVGVTPEMLKPQENAALRVRGASAALSQRGLWGTCEVRMCTARMCCGSTAGCRQQHRHQAGAPGGAAKKLEEERKRRSKDPAKRGRGDFNP